jgi:methylated-DNA-protein-cysteine methyltransferase related protein
MPKSPNYITAVHDITRQIPRGRVTTYGAIAEYLQFRAPRMVGWALRHAFSEIGVPAHRVVNRNGELSGRHQFPTPTMMQELLQSEGVEIVDNCVIDFKNVLWKPEEMV